MTRTYAFQTVSKIGVPWTEEFSPDKMNRGTIPIILRMAGEEVTADLFETQHVYFKKYEGGGINERIAEVTGSDYRVRQILSLNGGVTKMYRFSVPVILGGKTEYVTVITYGTMKGAWDAWCVRPDFKKKFEIELYGKESEVN